ncbi:MAG: restriction endonuclease [Methylotenera sp.]|nr:MAG: restriction endonuclease [Methylotenera sp.]
MRPQKTFFQELGSAAALFSDGDWIESKDQDSSGNIRLIQLADIGDGSFINKSNRFMNIETAKRLNCTFLKKGDILIARMPDPLGRCCIFPFDEHEKYVTVVDIAVLRLKENYDNSYVKHLINTPQIRHEISIQSTGTTRTRITRKKLEKLRVPLPPLAEQQKIAAILDAADSLRQKDQQLVERYTALSQSLFLEMFGDPVTNPMGWKTAKLKEVCNKITDGTHHSPELIEFGIPYVTAKHVKDYGLDFHAKATYVSQQDHDEIYKRCSPEYGDVLYIKDGATTGIACINTFKSPISLLSSLALIKPNRLTINNYYLCYWLNHKGIKEKLIKEYMSGAAIQRYTLAKINEFIVTLPPTTLQNQFAERIQLIEAQKQQAQRSLEKSEALFNSLLQRAYTGELTAKMAA